MNVTDAFEAYQEIVNADEKQVKTARGRRDLFKNAFADDPDVIEVKPSGSLARGTQKDPINDVDTIIVFDAAAHPDWGQPGDSAEEALNHTQTRVRELLGSDGTHSPGQVRLTRWRNHAVKCFLDDPDDPDAFTVDAMPALLSEGQYLVPEFATKTWILTDPQHLIDEVADRHAAWSKYAGTIRMLKAWAAAHGTETAPIKSLVMEVLALDYLPTNHTRPIALREFFTAATFQIENHTDVSDPADLCGPIQPDLDYTALADHLRAARDEAILACSAQARGDDAAAITHWGNVFASAFPKPPKTSPGPAVVPPLVPRPVKDTPQG